jgi:hypothetical protein
MVILYIYLTCRHMKSVFYECQQYHKLAEIHTITTAQLAECSSGVHRHRLISLPKPRRGSKANASNPRLTGGPARWVHNTSIMSGTRTMVSPAAGGGTTVIPRG